MTRRASRLLLAIAAVLAVLPGALAPAGAEVPGPPPDPVDGGAPDDRTAPPVDVPDDHPFATEIRWMVDDGVAAGYADGTFGPTRPLNRGGLAAFLARLVQPGEEPGACAAPPFDDVPVDHPFCPAVAWADDRGLLQGFGDGRFGPTLPVSRQALAAAVHRLVEGADEPAPACAGAPFADVAADHPFCPEVAWLAAHGIVAGFADGRFHPTATVSRQVVAAVLHRLMVRGFVLDPRPPEPEWYAGPLDGFYQAPDPLPWGPPGQLIRLQEVASDASRTTLRIMYHSRDAQGRDRAVTGLLTRPDDPAPAGGWPVVSTANGTVGLQSGCAPSRGGGTAGTYGITGVGVRSDYIGLGPVGELHPYLSRPSEGHSVIDAVRAARQLLGDQLSGDWLALGGSQGGHGALSASELGEEHAPELDLLGTVALAPAAMFEDVYGPVDRIVTRVVGIMMLYGAATEHPEIDPLDYVSDTTAAAAGVLQTGCLPEVTSVMAPLAATDDFWKADPTTTEPAHSLLLANDVGHAAVDSPVLLVSGTADTTVPIQRSRALNARLCASGQVTQFIEVEGAGHGNVHAMAAAEISAWLADRLTDAPAPNTCP